MFVALAHQLKRPSSDAFAIRMELVDYIRKMDQNNVDFVSITLQ